MYCTKVYSICSTNVKQKTAFRVYYNIDVYFMTNNKTLIYSVRLTESQRAKLDSKAKDLDMKPSELIRNHILKLLEYGQTTATKN